MWRTVPYPSVTLNLSTEDATGVKERQAVGTGFILATNKAICQTSHAAPSVHGAYKCECMQQLKACHLAGCDAHVIHHAVRHKESLVQENLVQRFALNSEEGGTKIGSEVDKFK